MASQSPPVLQKLPRTLRRAYSSLSAHLPRFRVPRSSQPTSLPAASPSLPALQNPPMDMDLALPASEVRTSDFAIGDTDYGNRPAGEFS